MNFQINQTYEHLKEIILERISNFNSYDNDFGTGKRNSVKKIDLSDRVVVIKSFKVPILINQIIYKYFRKSKAQRSFENANKLLAFGINTPSPIAYIEYGSLLGLRRSFYISEYLAYDLTYRDLVLNTTYPNRRKIIEAFTIFTYKLHELGIEFLDHSPGNTLIIKKDMNYEFYLVDLNRMNFKQLNFSDRMKNFSRLTPKKEMVEIMSEIYAQLSGEKFEKVFEKMWFYISRFQEKFHRKKQLKKRLLRKK